MKIFKLLSLSLLLVTVLSACNFPSGFNFKNSSGAVVVMVVTPTQTLIAKDHLQSAPVVIDLPNPTPLPPNAPVWSAYNYICGLTEGGGNMTMYLAWMDRSDSEESYKVYRDEKLISTLPPNSTYYADMVFVANGKSVSYSIEAFHKDWQVRAPTITYGCQ